MDKSHHLNAEAVEEYRQRKLSPAELLAADDHMATCPECRAAVLRAMGRAHLTEDQLQDYADDRLPNAEALEHLKQCSRCRTDAEDLREFAAGLSPRTRWIWPVASAAAIAAMVAISLSLFGHKPEAVHQVAQVGVARSNGDLPAELKMIRDHAIEAGAVDIPPSIRQLVGSQGVLRGNPSGRETVVLQGPLATAVLDPRPTFTWRPVADAIWYQVSVVDGRFNPILESPRLSDAKWTASRPLKPGQVYLWQLTVYVRGTQITAPQPPAPAAKFEVVDRAEASRLREIAARYPADHILLGVLYAKAGALDEARREWRTASGEGHSEANRLLAQLPAKSPSS